MKLKMKNCKNYLMLIFKVTVLCKIFFFLLYIMLQCHPLIKSIPGMFELQH